MESGAKCYELSLTENYVSDWTFNDAIRELIQNGTDQEILDAENEFSMEYDEEEKTLRLKNSKSKLKINTLLLGSSTKSKNEDTIGQFGEGYKIAALVLNRLGKTFTIYNNEKKEVWTSRFKNSEKWKEKILSFYIGQRETEDSGLCIEIGNVEENEYEDISEIWLEMCGFDYEKIKTTYGDILTDEEFEGNIFVNGLFVYKDNDLKYGYNFKPKYISLERDRKTCDSWSVEELTSKMIAEAMVNGDIEFETVDKMVSSNSSDVYHLSYNKNLGGTKKVTEMLIKSFDEKNTKPYSIPVTSQEDANKVKSYGGNPVYVAYCAGELLKAEANRRFEELVKTPCANGMTLKERFLRWYNAYEDKLSESSKEELKNLIEEIE